MSDFKEYCDSCNHRETNELEDICSLGNACWRGDQWIPKPQPRKQPPKNIGEEIFECLEALGELAATDHGFDIHQEGSSYMSLKEKITELLSYLEE